ncbi:MULTISPECIES: transglycosylase domain-containing protein [unclassified Leclercia]|uniref:Transglycosylase domain-containing protein n=1 Tax=Leclercia barmai TaxID=2785629 RepID=A0ABS7RZW4_9ENTR|nr:MULTISPECIES: transglycosylase domain-containing protein [unclassified Leclercia]MBZ0058563.1 transglycosylase domain-containing protein [Leclercia sp. EMC7]MCM5698407.1 transglycosylase domain-containing protein [Leclercia sp. LTM01]MCM5701118.1 transglycosylase domain-containing protein [Leclercia sp. LTM14]
MAAKRFLILLMSSPYLLLAVVVFKFRVKTVIDDYYKCIEYIRFSSRNENAISLFLIDVLRVAEDHRQLLHRGVDPVAILRTIYLRLFKNIRQGASTIDQQFVRTITKRYEKTVRRKIREQVLAILVRQASTADDICKAYISCCYFGYGTYGIAKLIKTHASVSDFDIAARVKYPFKKNVDELTEGKFNRRAIYISYLCKVNPNRVSIFLRK